MAGLLSEALGWGGTKRVSELTGLDPKTIRQGRIDLKNNLANSSPLRIRSEGAGRPHFKKNTTIEQELIQLIELETGGDPEGHVPIYSK